MVTPTDLPLLTGASLAASSSVTAPDSTLETRSSRAVPSSGLSRSSLSGTGNPCAGAGVGVIVGVDMGAGVGVAVAVGVGSASWRSRWSRRRQRWHRCGYGPITPGQ